MGNGTSAASNGEGVTAGVVAGVVVVGLEKMQSLLYRTLIGNLIQH